MQFIFCMLPARISRYFFLFKLNPIKSFFILIIPLPLRVCYVYFVNRRLTYDILRTEILAAYQQVLRMSEIDGR